MPILQQLFAHAVIVTMALGGMGCLCPAEAATSRAAVAHAKHEHQGAHAVDARTRAGCGHEQCGPDCTRASAAAAKSKALKSTAPGKNAPTLDDAAFLPAGVSAWPEVSRQRGRSVAPFIVPVRMQDSPVRRFDRLLD
jgi:hypothetical protein